MDDMKRLGVALLLIAAGCWSATPSGTSTPVGQESAADKSVSKSNDAPPALTVGSPAPPLKVSRFLQGEPVTSFEPGKIYVIEFWATWCGPCLEAMPYVAKLQQQYPEVTFIGVNVWEKDESAPEELVKKVGPKLGYRIARDDIPDRNADSGAMAITWLNAAEASGIPTAMVVDGQGRIAEITHPMTLDESLPQIIAGKWDYAAAARQHLKDVLEVREQQ